MIQFIINLGKVRGIFTHRICNVPSLLNKPSGMDRNLLNDKSLTWIRLGIRNRRIYSIYFYSYWYHAIKNTTNQNKRNQLYIRQYCSRPFRSYSAEIQRAVAAFPVYFRCCLSRVRAKYSQDVNSWGRKLSKNKYLTKKI